MNALHIVQWLRQLWLFERYAQTLRAHRQRSDLLFVALSAISRNRLSRRTLYQMDEKLFRSSSLVPYLALSVLMLSSHDGSPQKGDSSKLLLLRW